MFITNYYREDPPTLISNRGELNTDDYKTERILPDIEDNEEIESLIVRTTNTVKSNKNSETEVEKTIEHMETSTSVEITEEEVAVTSQCNKESRTDSESKSIDETRTVEIVETHDLPIEESQTPTTNKSEIEHLSQLIVNMESEFSNVELSNQNTQDKVQNECQDTLSVEPGEKQSEEDEAISVSYHKISPEPIECKIIVAHEDTDVSSITSTDSIQCDLEIQKITSTYQYKYSQSLPSTPMNKKKFYRSLSRASLRSDFDRSNENLCSYPVGFEATTLQDYLKDNYNDEDMELEEPEYHSYMKQNDELAIQRAGSHTPTSASPSKGSVLKARRSKVPSSPISARSSSSYYQMEEEDEDEEDSDSESYSSDRLNEKDDDEEDEEDQLKDKIEVSDEKKNIIFFQSSADIDSQIMQQRQQHHQQQQQQQQQQQPHTEEQRQDQSTSFRSQSSVTDIYSGSQFPLDHHSINQQQTQHPVVSIHHETYPLSNSEISENLLNISECVDPTTSMDSKSYSSSKSVIQKPSTELLNISEDAHAGPMNVFEFDGLQILVPSTFISESSQKAVSGTSQQSMSSSENGAGNDEEVKSVNMRADETMPARGELSEQESNGCTEQSAWQVGSH